MKNKIKKIAVALLAFTVGCVSLTGCNVRQDTIRFGAAGVGGGYYAFATAYTQLANAEDAKMKFNIKSTAGSMANLRLLSEGYVDVAIAQADLATAAYYGTDEKGESYQGYRVLAGLYTEACQIVVRKDSGIKSLDDLQGKTVSIKACPSWSMPRSATKVSPFSIFLESIFTFIYLPVFPENMCPDFLKSPVNITYQIIASKLHQKCNEVAK